MIRVNVNNMQAVAQVMHDLHKQSPVRHIGSAVNACAEYIAAAGSGALPCDDESFAPWFSAVGGENVGVI